MWNLSTNCLQLEFFLVQGDLKNKCVLHLIEPSQKKNHETETLRKIV